MNPKLFTALTRQFLRFLEELSPDDITALDGKLKRLEIRLLPTKSKKALGTFDIQSIAEKLKAAEDKSVVEDLISTLTKDELEQICRQLDFSVQKSDNVERLRERIVQSTVGFKTRSKAIQG